MNLQPITPFEPVSSEEIPSGSNWISQIKWDGVRVLTYYDGNEVRLFNRQSNERSAIFPELTAIKSYSTANSVILDGEVIALDMEGKPSFHEVMRRDGIRRVERVNDVRNEVPIYYMIFDVVFYNGKWVNNQPLRDRLSLLSEIIIPNQQIQIVPNQIDGKSLFEVIRQHDLEGIICKNLTSRYTINGKNDDWKKIKNYKDVIAVVGGVTYRAGIVNAMVLGLYDEQQRFWYIGHVGTGKLTHAEWKEFTRMIDPLKTDQLPFVNQPDRPNNIQWLEPVITVKVNYIEWPKGHSLRQPSIQAFVDHSPESCLIIEKKGR